MLVTSVMYMNTTSGSETRRSDATPRVVNDQPPARSVDFLRDSWDAALLLAHTLGRQWADRSKEAGGGWDDRTVMSLDLLLRARCTGR